MKLKFVGVGSMSNLKNSNTSLLINNEVLFDIGSGVVRQLCIQNSDLTKIKYLIITHFHSDHIMDIVDFLYRRMLNGGKSVHLQIIGPKNIRNYVKHLLDITHGDGQKDAYGDLEDKFNLEFIEVLDEVIYFDNYTLEAILVKHVETILCNGYVLSDGNSTFSFTGDAEFCDGVEKLIQKSNNIILDGTLLEYKAGHMGYYKIEKIAKNNQDKNFYVTHRSNYEVDKIIDNLILPNDGDEIEIGD